MTFSALTNQVRISGQSSSRNGAAVDTFLIHHQAGTSDDAVINAMVSGSKQVSANYTISNEGRLTGVVPEELRAWTSGSSTDGGKGAQWDRRAITVEIENEATGGSWPISEAALNTAAKLLQDLRRRYGIANVLGHRDLWTRYRASYATFCPGPNTVAQIVAIAATSTAALSSTPITEQDDEMYILQDPAPTGAIYLAGPGAVIHIQNSADHAILRRLVTRETIFTLAELKRITYYMNAFENSGAASTIDPAKLAAELAKAGVTVTIDTAAIAKAVDASLRDDFAAIPGAVIGGIKAAL